MIVSGYSVTDATATGKDGVEMTVGTTTFSTVFPSIWLSTVWTFTGTTVLALNAALPTLLNMPAGTQSPKLP